MEEEGYGGIVPLGFYENQLLGSNGMPLGFRFHPTDQELISFFPYNRVLRREYCENLIYEFDLFGKTPPWVVWENFGGPGLQDQDLYFFCQLKPRSQARIKREIDAGGTWSQSNSKPVKNLQNEKAIGKKRNLRWFSADLKRIRGTKNKKNNSNSTQQVNQQPAKMRARKEVKEKPAKKRATKEESKKPAKTKARNEVRSPNTTSVITHTIEELQNCPSTSSAPVLPLDESNYKMISDAINHDQQCISNIDSSTMPANFDSSTMPANFSDHDYVVSEGDESLLKDEDLLFDNGEDMFFDLNYLFAPLDCESAWSQEKLLQIDEAQVPLPLDGMNCWDDCLWMGSCVQ
nr:NAC domain-containing protein 105-like [Malus domestica]